MKTLRRCWVAGLLVVAAACGESVAGPSPDGPALRDGGGLMGSGTRIDPPPPPPGG